MISTIVSCRVFIKHRTEEIILNDSCIERCHFQINCKRKSVLNEVIFEPIGDSHYSCFCLPDTNITPDRKPLKHNLPFILSGMRWV